MAKVADSMGASAFRKQLTDAAKAVGAPKALKVLEREARPCAYLYSPGSARTSEMKSGGSRFGGLPDLPKAVEWPAGVNKAGNSWGYARFLAQINFAEVPPIDRLALPRKGLLWIFSRGWVAGVEVAAIYEPNPGKLARRKAPTEKDWGHGAPRGDHAVPLRFKPGLSLPIYRNSFFKDLERAGGIGDKVFYVINELGLKDADGQVGGYSVVPNTNLYRAIAFRQLGQPEYRWADFWESVEAFDKSLDKPPPWVDDDGKKKYRAEQEKLRPRVKWIDAHRAELAKEAAAWQLLLRFDSGLGGLELGDGMHLEISARSSDIAAGSFANLVAECPMLL